MVSGCFSCSESARPSPLIIELQRQALAGVGHPVDDLPPSVEILDRPLVGGALHCFGCRPVKASDCLAPLLASQRVVSEALYVLIDAVRVQILHRLHDPHVQRAPLFREHALVRNVVCQGVLKRILRIGQQPRFVHQFRPLQLEQGLAKRFLIEISDQLQKLGGDVFTDDGGLQEVLGVRRQAVDAGGEHRLNRGRDPELFNRYAPALPARTPFSTSTRMDSSRNSGVPSRQSTE